MVDLKVHHFKANTAIAELQRCTGEAVILEAPARQEELRQHEVVFEPKAAPVEINIYTDGDFIRNTPLRRLPLGIVVWWRRQGPG